VVPDGTVIGENSRIDRKRFHITERGVVVVNRKMLGQGSGYQPAFASEGRARAVISPRDTPG
jgi:hypothetical protein